MKLNKRFLSVLKYCLRGAALGAALLLPLSAQAQDRDAPTDITAQRMTYDAGKQQLVFEGKVHVVNGDFIMDSQRLTIYMKDNPNAGETEGESDPFSGMQGGDLDRLVAEGSVTMQKEGRIGECGRATYYMDRELVVMEQNPFLHDGENRISGQVINFWVAQNRSEVIGGEGQPVRATIRSTRE